LKTLFFCNSGVAAIKIGLKFHLWVQALLIDLLQIKEQLRDFEFTSTIHHRGIFCPSKTIRKKFAIHCGYEKLGQGFFRAPILFPWILYLFHFVSQLHDTQGSLDIGSLGVLA
jgi:hypothetical protein